MGVNEFSDMNDQEVEDIIEIRSGLKLPHSGEIRPFTVDEVYQIEQSIKHPHSLETSSEPESVNWFDRGYVSIPYAQGGCGSCWAFSAAAALESLAMISGFDASI